MSPEYEAGFSEGYRRGYADATSKKLIGYWIFKGIYMECSNCHSEFISTNWKYCFECGSDNRRTNGTTRCF